MTLRTAKMLLLFALAVFYSFLVFNNLTDYDSNFQFIRHVLMMDSTLPGNHGMWRALNHPVWHMLFYWTIIAWEILTMLLCWWAGWKLARTLRNDAPGFHRARYIAIAALTSSLLMWLVAFLSIGGEWFLMWQSKTWNGQEAAFRMFAVVGIVLLLVALPEAQEQS
jgi:predicted small integral membrane protein